MWRYLRYWARNFAPLEVPAFIETHAALERLLRRWLDVGARRHPRTHRAPSSRPQRHSGPPRSPASPGRSEQASAPPKALTDDGKLSQPVPRYRSFGDPHQVERPADAEQVAHGLDGERSKLNRDTRRSSAQTHRCGRGARSRIVLLRCSPGDWSRTARNSQQLGASPLASCRRPRLLAPHSTCAQNRNPSRNHSV
jgi:hypothetical protein